MKLLFVLFLLAIFACSQTNLEQQTQQQDSPRFLILNVTSTDTFLQFKWVDGWYDPNFGIANYIGETIGDDGRVVTVYYDDEGYLGLIEIFCKRGYVYSGNESHRYICIPGDTK